MKRLLVLFVTIIFGAAVNTAYGAELKKPVQALPSAASKVQTSAAPTMPPPTLLVVNTPNGGESWVSGTQRDITWTRSGIAGMVTLDLYRGGTSPQNKVGTIASGVPVAFGKFTWVVGSYQGGNAPPSNDYRIIIVGADNKTDMSNAPFSITPKMEVNPSTPLNTNTGINSAAASNVKLVRLTYPRRADGLHKGMLYTIKWESINLATSKLKIELLNNQETTVISALNDLSNTGETRWFVPMTLPDEKTFYKMRIQTVDGLYKNTVGPFSISKITAPSGGPSLTVNNPLTEQRAIGTTIPVKWTSAVSCSGNGGPLDDGFRIELMQGSKKIRDLTDVGYTFDGEKPGGYINWLWNWEMVRGSITPGTYSVRVTSMITPSCTGKSQTFSVFDPQPANEKPAPVDNVLLTNAQFTNRTHCASEVYSSDNTQPGCPPLQDVAGGQGQVGSISNYMPLGGSIFAAEHKLDYRDLRSKIFFPVNQVSMANRKLKYANLQMKVTMAKTGGDYIDSDGNWKGYSLGYQLCGYSLYRLNGAWNDCMDMPVDPGEIRVSNDQTTVNVNVTSMVGDWLTGTKPNNGFLLTNYRVQAASADVPRTLCWSYFTATLYLEFEKSVLVKPDISKMPMREIK